MKKKVKKLVLAKETMRDLDSPGLKAVAGGARTDFVTCGVSCFYFDTCFC
jgi:natural product precursor